MLVQVLEEHGHETARLGMALSYYDHTTPLQDWWNDEKQQRAVKRAASLSHKGGGHSKFLESIQVWIYVQASRDFWSEFDTYRVGITKQSSSTMHTLDKRQVTLDDFEEGVSVEAVEAFNMCLKDYKNPDSPHYKDVSRLKKNLPEGWLQERVINTNYKCLQNIITQRHNHRLRQWSIFCEAVLKQIRHPEFLWQDS